MDTGNLSMSVKEFTPSYEIQQLKRTLKDSNLILESKSIDERELTKKEPQMPKLQ